MVYLPPYLFSYIIKTYLPSIRDIHQRKYKKVIHKLNIIFKAPNPFISNKFIFRPKYGYDSVIDYIYYIRRTMKHW